MAKPLRSEDPNPPSVQFRDFGVLNTGAQSTKATVTSLTVNILVLAVIVILGMVVKHNPVMAKKVADLYSPPVKVELPKPKPPPPPPPPPVKLPPTPKVEPPKIKMPEPKIPPPPEIKPVVMPKPVAPVITPPAPKKIDPPPAPKVVSINNMAAHVPNNDAHPSPVKAGFEVIKTTGPAVATKVTLGGGVPGMPGVNTGNGPRATSVSLGSGVPGGSNVNSHDRGAVKVAGLGTGVPGGTGTGRNGPVAVAIAPPAAAERPAPVAVARTQATPPVLTYKPAALYTDDAKNAHIEGSVRVKITVTASGAVQVLGVVSGLGHGLDQQAEAVARGMRFKPALDSTGHPIDSTIIVNVAFQLS